MPGIAGEAWAVVSARARIRPALMKLITVGGVANITWVSPAIVEVAAAPPPLNWTVVKRTPAIASNCAVARCGVDPLPEDAALSLSGLARA